MNTTLNLLIIEDSEDDALLLTQELASAGYELNWKRVEAEPEFRASLGPHLHLICSDFSLPRFSTPHAISLLQASGLNIPFIIVSGTIGEEHAVECLKSGATDYVLKDRLTRLGPVVARALSEARSRAEHQRAVEELRWRTALLEALVDSAPDGILVVNDHGKKVLQNSRFNRLLKIPADIAGDEGEAKQIRHIASLTKDPQQFTARAAWLNSRPDEAGQDEVELADGTVLERYYAPVLNQAGRNYGKIWTFRDITARRKLEEQYRQAQKMEAIGQLAGGVAHDFNNNLAVIQGYASLLQASSPTPEETRECLEQIVQTVGNAANLTRQLLAFSRKQVMQLQLLDLNQVVGHLAKILQRVLGEDISLHFNYHSVLSPVLADAGMLEQVLMNLAVNARDAMPRGGRLIISTLEQTVDEEYQRLNPDAASGDYVCLMVADTGTGIPPEIMPRIFEPFFTTKETGKGTGLGLATVYGIVRQHHGWINLYSELGQGTVFRLYFPVRKGEHLENNPRAASQSIPGGTETILLVEDEPSVRSLTKRLLERKGYTVIEARSGAAALETWRQHRDQVHLVLTDMVMPDGVSGPDLVKIIAREKPGLRTIFTSGYGAEFAGKDLELTEGVNYLQKPCAFPHLAQTIRKVLDQPENLG
jgi:signal transduction histidine kinase/DNA-binding response OmpR family regulator